MLNRLDRSASTARVLNLWHTHRRVGEDLLVSGAPFFQHSLLDRSIILKHRLRPHEYEYFDEARLTVTKVLVPIDPTDLRAGARSFYVRERDFDRLIEQLYGEGFLDVARDRKMLELLDNAPSLDPFMLRETLKAANIEPSADYFEISPADIRRMHGFIQKEIGPIAAITMERGDEPQAVHRLAGKLLSTWPEREFGDLGSHLQMVEDQYVEGMRAWRGLLYYKWALTEVEPAIGAVLEQIARITGHGANATTAEAVAQAKIRLRRSTASLLTAVASTLRRYDKAYASMTEHQSAAPFRTFLIEAPAGFRALGELLGGLQHVVSFWRYRFPEGGMPLVQASELLDILIDFEHATAVNVDGLSASYVA